MNLQKEIERVMVERLKSSSRNDYSKVIHASDIYDFCPRRYALYKLNKNINVQELFADVSTALTFEIGKKIQNIIIENAPSLMGIWVCDSCFREHYGIRPKKCNNCFSKKFIYKEVEIKYNCGDYILMGHIDMIHKEVDNSVVVEIKSINPEDFDLLTSPKLQHEYQVMTYLYLIKENKKLKDKLIKEFKLTSKYGYILYVCKTKKKEPFKLFIVKLSKSFNNKMNSYLESLKTFSETKILPERICNNKLYLLARNCKISNLCFEKE